MRRRRDVRRDTLNAAETDAETKDSVTLLVCPISAGTHAETTSARSIMSFVGIRSRKLTKIIEIGKIQWQMPILPIQQHVACRTSTSQMFTLVSYSSS